MQLFPALPEVVQGTFRPAPFGRLERRGGGPCERGIFIVEHTTNYQLSQWESTDRILMADFNGDNAKIDAALAAHDAALASKADAADVTALTQTVAGKGNCQITYGTYTGNGNYGSQHPNTLTFPFEPKLVIIQNITGAATDGTSSSTFGMAMMVLVRPVAGFTFVNGDFTNTVRWSGNTISWWGETVGFQLNGSGNTYLYAALG